MLFFYFFTSDNLDAAIDESNRLGDDPLMPDQDPEGGLHNEALLQDDRVHENRVHDDTARGELDQRLQDFGGNDAVGEHFYGGKPNNNPDFVDDTGNAALGVGDDVRRNINVDDGTDSRAKRKAIDGTLDTVNFKQLDNGDLDGAVDNPLTHFKEDGGGEVETGDKNDALPDEDIIDNRAKENFFGDNPPLRLQMNKNNNGDTVNNNRRDHSLDDNMVVDVKK